MSICSLRLDPALNLFARKSDNGGNRSAVAATSSLLISRRDLSSEERVVAFPHARSSQWRLAAAMATAEVEKGGGFNRLGSLSQVTGVLGCQWGDEGKGKLVDILAEHFDLVARCQVRAFLL